MGTLYYPYQELAFCRPVGSTEVMVTTNVTSGDYANLGCHLMVVDRKIFVSGYHFAGRNIPSNKPIRLWTYRVNEKTLLPYGPAIERSDTFLRTINSASSSQSRDVARPPVLRYLGASTDAAERYVDIQLPEGFFILIPGMYYIAVLMDTFHTNEEYFGSWIQGYSRGTRDCIFEEAVDFEDPAAPAYCGTLDLAEPLYNHKWFFPPTSISNASLCNINFAFITEDRAI